MLHRVVRSGHLELPHSYSLQVTHHQPRSPVSRTRGSLSALVPDANGSDIAKGCLIVPSFHGQRS